MATADDEEDLVPIPGQVEFVNPFREAPIGLRATCSVVAIVMALLFLSWNLGAYGLWSDEADTVLFAEAVWQTGDTAAVLGQNVYAYRKGELLHDLHNRHTPPLSYYLLAPFAGRWGAEPWAMRAPFALCGLAMVVLAIVWLWRSKANLAQWVSVLVVGFGNVSLFLFARQCRYYALAMLTTMLVTYFYLRHRGGWGTLFATLVTSLGLLTTQYLNFAALVVVLAVDYFTWQRHVARWTRRDAIVLFTPLVITGGLLWWFWSGHSTGGNGPIDRLVLAWWNLRDLHACETVNLLLVVAAPLLWLMTRDQWLLRIAQAIVVYALAVALLSPQPVGQTQVADIRYLAPAIPLGIALTARWLYWLVIHVTWKALAVVAIVAWTNAQFLLVTLLVAPPSGFHGWITEIERSFRVTPWQFIQEIAAPRQTAARTVSAWINEHVAPGQSVWVVPGEETYPHMAQAPHAIYAWQLDAPVAEQFRDLPPIHVFGQQPVDIIIVYGPFVSDPKLTQLLDALKIAGHEYRRVATLDVFWDDAIRPELFWHRFHDVRHFDRDTQAIYIFQRNTP